MSGSAEGSTRITADDPRRDPRGGGRGIRPGSRSRRNPFVALVGLVAALVAVGAGELSAAVFAPGASPVLAVGSLAIDLAPGWAKETAIALFGTADKIALVAGMGVVIAALAVGAAFLEQRKPPVGRLLFYAAALVGIVAATTRADAVGFSGLPALVAGVVGGFALMFLVRRVPPVREPASAAADSAAGPEAERQRVLLAEAAGESPDAPSRRTFLLWAGGATAVGLLATVGGSLLQAGGRAAAAARAVLKLPPRSGPAAVIPAGAELGVSGLAPVITPNEDFYRIDTALQVPQIDPAGWTLRITGMVENEIEITWDELVALPLEESVTTLMCVSNEIGGSLIGTARWLGYPIRELLARAKPLAGADMVLSAGQDGFTAGTPIEALTDDRNAILAVGMNGELLPFEHGFPVRMVVPGLYGYVSATKWVTGLNVTTYARDSAYWTQRGWGARGPIKIGSRIDTPRLDTIDPGTVVVAGLAWHQHTGISRVEVQVDGGAWAEAELADAISPDTWRQWRWEWEAEEGDHTLRVRATGADGEVQTSDIAGLLPDGATGYHEVSIGVR